MKKTILILALAAAVTGCSKATVESRDLEENEINRAIDSATLVTEEGMVYGSMTKHCDEGRLIIVAAVYRGNGTAVIENAPECN